MTFDLWCSLMSRLPHCLGCNLDIVFSSDEARLGADGEYTILCENCGHTMVTDGKQGVRDLTRKEWKVLPDKSWFEVWKDAREHIVERMIG